MQKQESPEDIVRRQCKDPLDWVKGRVRWQRDKEQEGRLCFPRVTHLHLLEPGSPADQRKVWAWIRNPQEDTYKLWLCTDWPEIHFPLVFMPHCNSPCVQSPRCTKYQHSVAASPGSMCTHGLRSSSPSIQWVGGKQRHRGEEIPEQGRNKSSPTRDEF